MQTDTSDKEIDRQICEWTASACYCCDCCDCCGCSVLCFLDKCVTVAVAAAGAPPSVSWSLREKLRFSPVFLNSMVGSFLHDCFRNFYEYVCECWSESLLNTFVDIFCKCVSWIVLGMILWIMLKVVWKSVRMFFECLFEYGVESPLFFVGKSLEHLINYCLQTIWKSPPTSYHLACHHG